jgi:hypothetical protein
MTYSGLIPSMEAIQQAVREPLFQAPQDYQQFAIYIFERARQIDRDKARTKAQPNPLYGPDSLIAPPRRIQNS